MKLDIHYNRKVKVRFSQKIQQGRVSNISVRAGLEESEEEEKVDTYEAANRDEGDANALDNMIFYFYKRD